VYGRNFEKLLVCTNIPLASAHFTYSDSHLW